MTSTDRYSLLLPEESRLPPRFTFATVTEVDPLRIALDEDRLDTEFFSLPYTPPTLISGAEVVIGDRVLVMRHNGRKVIEDPESNARQGSQQLIVLGKIGGRVGSIEIGAGVDLDTVKVPGSYTQSQSGEATLALNYPEAAKAGILEVFFNEQNTTPDTWWQRYTLRSPDHNRFYVRGIVGSVIGTWYRYDADPGPIVLDSSSFTPASGWTIAYCDIRTAGRYVTCNVRCTRTTALTIPTDGNNTNTPILTITKAAYFPPAVTALATASTGPMVAICVEATGVVNLTAVSTGLTTITNAEISASGSWMV